MSSTRLAFLISLPVLATASLWTSGCGGGGSSSTSTASCSAGSVGAIPIDQLTSAQRATACSDVQSCGASETTSIDGPIQDLICRTTGIELAGLSGAQTDDQLRQACQQFYDECIQTPDAGVTPPPDAGSSLDHCNAELSTLTTACAATVSQLVTCLDDSSAATIASINAALQSVPTCASLTLANLAAAADAGAAGTTAIDTTSTTVASCQSLRASCPGLFSSSDGGVSP